LLESADVNPDNMSPPQGAGGCTQVQEGLFELKPFMNVDQDIKEGDKTANECDNSYLEEELPKNSYAWVYYSMLAAALLALCNTTMSDLSSIGIEGLLYLSPGNLICGLMFCSLEHMIRTMKGPEVFSSP